MSADNLIEIGLDAVKIENIYNRIDTLLDAIQYDSALCLAEKALTLSQKINWTYGIAKAYLYLGKGYFKISDFSLAHYYLSQSQALAFNINDHYLLSKIYDRIGTVFQYEAKIDSAQKYLFRAIPYALEAGDTLEAIFCYQQLGFGTEAISPLEAIQYFYQALNYAKRIDNKKEIINSGRGIGMILSAQKLYPEANKYFYSYLSYTRSHYKKGTTSFAYMHLSILHYQQGNFDSVYFYANKILEEYPFTQNKYHLYHAYHMLSSYFNHMHLPDQALPYAKIVISDQGINYTYIMESLADMARSYYLKGDLDKALYYAERAVKGGGRYTTQDDYSYLAKLHEEKGDFHKAYLAEIKSVSILDSIQKSNTQFLLGRGEFEKEMSLEKMRFDSLQNEKQVQSLLASSNSQKRNLSYGFSLFILVIGAYGFYNYRNRKIKENLLALNTERLRISRDLHDEVGATLSGISMYSHIAKEQIKFANREAIENSLTIMQESSREMVNKLNDIVWLLNPDQSQLGELVGKLEGYAIQMTDAKGITITTTIDENFSNLELPLEVRRNIYLICKEAINNVVKYSEASRLHIRMGQSEGSLEFLIQDNGIGLNTEAIKRGNGLNNMEQRATEMGGELRFISQIGAGTTISLKYKIT